MSRFFCLILCVFLFVPVLFADEYVFSYKNKKETKEEVYNIFNEGNNLVVTFKSNNYESYSLTGPDGSGLFTSFNFVSRDLNITAEMLGNNLYVNGNNGKKQVSKNIKSSGLPWYTSLLLLPSFIKSDQKTVDFCIFLPQQESRLFEMTATKEKEETIIIMGEETETVKVKVTMSGFLGAFWDSYFWYRLSDGLYVKSEESAAVPGNGTTYTELIRVN